LYQALYRKWRPKTFDDVIGQEQVTKTLKNEVSTGKISHAYLFTGSRGTGKTSCAKILAKSINCQNPKNGNPCGECEICKSIDSENMLDISEIDAASNNGVENIRNMREELAFAPTKCKYRVYIVDEVHMLSVGAFNAFLKILEEPPSHVVFILATTEINKIPATIISRCQRFDFKRIGTDDMLKRIAYICKEENITIDNDAAQLIAKAADGAVRDALSILDQCANSCKNKIDAASVKNILGISGTEYIKETVKNIFNHNYKFCFDLISKMYMESKNMLRFCEEITEYFRLLMISKTTKESTIHEFPESKDASLKDILWCLDTLQESYKNMALGANKKTEMEITLVKLCSKFVDCLSSKPEVKNIKTEENLDFIAPQVQNQKESFPPIVKNTVLDEENVGSGLTFTKWGEILAKLKEMPSFKSLYISLKDSHAYESGSYILIDSKNELAFELLRKFETRDTLKKIIKDVTGQQRNLGPYKGLENKNENQNKDTKDPLENLIDTAKKSGININLEEN